MRGTAALNSYQKEAKDQNWLSILNTYEEQACLHELQPNN